MLIVLRHRGSVLVLMGYVSYTGDVMGLPVSGSLAARVA